MRLRTLVAAATASLWAAACINWTAAEQQFCVEQPSAPGCEVEPDGGTGGGGVGGGSGGGGAVGGGSGGGDDAGTDDAGTDDAGTVDAGPVDAGPSTAVITFTVLAGDAGATGRIEWLDGGLVCDESRSPCSASFDAGARLILRGVPGGLVGAPSKKWSALVGFTGCDAPLHGRCELTVTGPAGVEASFDRPNLAFLTTNTYVVGAFSVVPTDGGAAADAIALADGLCAAHAADAGLPGTFSAFLGRQTPFHNPFGALGSARGWIRVDGKPMFDVLESSTSSNLLYPLLFTERQQRLPGDTAIATAMNSSGDPGNSCVNFTAVIQMAYGAVAMGGTHWYAYNSGGSCSGQYHLACFGTDRSVAVQVDRSQPTRLAFVTQTSWRMADAGVAAADALCTTEASQLHGITDGGVFKAFLYANGEDPYARLASRTLPWARPDGVVVVQNATGFNDLSNLEAPLSNQPGVVFWVGSSGNNCSDWSDTAPLGNPRRGRAFDSGPSWDNTVDLLPGGGFPVCSTTSLRLACFQQ